MRLRGLQVMLVAVLAEGCSPGTEPVGSDTRAGTEVLDDGGGDTAPDGPGADLARDLGPDRIEEGAAFDESSPCQPGTGCFGDPCVEGKDCLSGYCILHLGERICTDLCTEECPQDFECRKVAGTEPDVVYVCDSTFPSLCLPCAEEEQCSSLAGPGSSCVGYGPAGYFCGAACAVEGDCPEGYACEQVATVTGLLTSQCLHESGTCSCTEVAVSGGMAALCGVENEHGACDGLRACTPEGLGPCDAPVPAPDLCDGLDNDCDGGTDEAGCDDGRPCTTDLCLGPEGCAHEARTGGECLDGDACTIGDHCEAGDCTGSPLICDDVNPCTDDSCDPDLGCQYAYPVLPCDDGNPCTVGDTCLAGACVALPGACACEADADCLALAGGNLCLGDWYCSKAEAPWQCVLIPGTGVQCPPPSGKDRHCYVNVCQAGTGLCQPQPVNPGGPCDDGDLCSAGDLCSGGVCEPGPAPGCDDGKPCTDDGCLPATGCFHQNNAATCSDGNACSTGDHCQDGACLPTALLSCNDGNPCTDDACLPGTGCQHVANQAPCSDGLPCTQGDHCSNGWCTPITVLDCDDGNPCTDDACHPTLSCTHSVNTAACDDGDSCTTGDHCHLGACLSGTPLACNDGNPCTADACIDGVGCQHIPQAASCSDGNACTLGDHCAGGACVPASMLSCDDGNPCTDDGCAMATGCTHAPNVKACSDGDACTLNDQCQGGGCTGGPSLPCDDGNPCTDDGCDALTGCEFLPGNGPCDDGNLCTVVDQCSGGACVGSGTPACGDTDACTMDSCDPKLGCVHTDIVPCCGNGEKEAGEECDDGNLLPGDGCSDQCESELGLCSNGSTTDCNPPGTTLIPSSRFVDPSPPADWVQCAGFVNTGADDVSNTFLNNCLNTTRLRVRAWNGGSLEEDVYSTNMSSWSAWPNWNYLGGSITKAKATYWTGSTTYFTAANGNDACSTACCNAAPSGTLTLGTGNGSSVIFAPGNTDGLEWRVSCGGQALAGRSIAVYR